MFSAWNISTLVLHNAQYSILAQCHPQRLVKTFDIVHFNSSIKLTETTQRREFFSGGGEGGGASRSRSSLEGFKHAETVKTGKKLWNFQNNDFQHLQTKFYGKLRQFTGVTSVEAGGGPPPRTRSNASSKPTQVDEFFLCFSQWNHKYCICFQAHDLIHILIWNWPFSYPRSALIVVQCIPSANYLLVSYDTAGDRDHYSFGLKTLWT